MHVRVVVADDHAVVRRGTREILEGHPEIEVVGEASDGEAAVEMAGRLAPDVVVLDLEMPLLNGLEATGRITELHPGTGVVILTVHDEASYVVNAIRAGARGFLLKHVRDQALIDGVLRVAAGEAVIDSSLTSAVVLAMQAGGPGPRSDRPSLTPRRLDVLRLAARGLSNRDIAAVLGLSDRTVEVHLTGVFKALGVSSRTEAVTTALRMGLITLDEAP